ncbi:DNRLRE domain-containing protein [Paractinoplanes lichenicola]|uniref:DNRLRE domain-containing protein n=1 Tax=Paractinoplanes lichenicola TaxID=2802976 RepID=A0ABS1VZJ7_9ACTN|nr:DNRLRE domain-containing protein [Actinoplanes lichenicola]MBL7259919.1 DNRLRE domain-containing protein [Actinoplanes lichenicola]
MRDGMRTQEGLKRSPKPPQMIAEVRPSRIVAGLTVIAAVGTLVQFSAKPTFASPSTNNEWSCPNVQPEEAAALDMARRCGVEIEISSRTNEYDWAVALPDGQVRWDHHYRPVRVKRVDNWIPVDTTLTLQPNGTVKPIAAAVDLEFSGGGLGPMVAITEDRKTMRLGSPLGGLPVPVLDGSTATYREVLPGVDVRLQADVDGFSQVLIVKDRAAASNPRISRLEFPISTNGLNVTSDGEGNLRAIDLTGKPRFAGNAPEMWDASQRTVNSTQPFSDRGSSGRIKRMETLLSGKRLLVTPDRRMLEDPKTRYPVYIDPGVTAARSSWTKVNSLNPTTSYWNSTGAAQVGGTNISNNKYRSFFNLDAGSAQIAKKHINEARFVVQQNYSLYCEARAIELWSTSYAGGSTTWNNQPTWSTQQGTVTSLAGCNSSNPAASISFDVTSHVQTAADGSWGNLTYGLRSPDESGLRSYKELSNNPYVSISYTAFPTIGGRDTSPAAMCTVGSSRPYINTATPVLRVKVDDIDGTSVRPEIEWNSSSGSRIGSATPLPGQAPGTYFGARVPASSLVNGGTYSWRARAFDSTVWGPWSDPCEFTVDTSAPATAPPVISMAYPESGWNGSAGLAGSFSFAAGGISDIAAYVYGLDDDDPRTRVAASSLGGTANVNIAPAADGPHALYVRSLDRAGNESPTTIYTFNVGSPENAPTPSSDAEDEQALSELGEPNSDFSIEMNTVVEQSANIDSDIVSETGGTVSNPNAGVSASSINTTQPWPPIVWAACGMFTDDQKVVRSYDRSGVYNFGGGISRLKCGDRKWGYRHIKDRHLADWQYISNFVGRNWRDAADWGIWNTLWFPETSFYRADNNTWGFTCSLYLIDKKTGKTVKVMYGFVSVAHQSKNIITALPTNKRKTK